MHSWLQSKDHLVEAQGEVFLLTSEQELDQYGLTILIEQEDVVYSNNGYIILLFDNVSDLKLTVSQQ